MVSARFSVRFRARVSARSGLGLGLLLVLCLVLWLGLMLAYEWVRVNVMGSIMCRAVLEFALGLGVSVEVRGLGMSLD